MAQHPDNKPLARTTGATARKLYEIAIDTSISNKERARLSKLLEQEGILNGDTVVLKPEYYRITGLNPPVKL